MTMGVDARLGEVVRDVVSVLVLELVDTSNTPTFVSKALSQHDGPCETRQHHVPPVDPGVQG